MKQINLDQVQADLTRWEEGETVDEAALLSYAHWSRATGQRDELARTLTLLATRRFRETETMDPLLNRWMKELESMHALPAELRVSQLNEKLRRFRQTLQIEWPTLREADYASMKVQILTDYEAKTSSLLDQLDQLHEEVERAKSDLRDSEFKHQLEQLSAVVVEAMQEVAALEDDTASLLASMQGNYFSREAFRRFNERVTAVKSRLETIIGLLPEQKRETKSSGIEKLETMIGLTDIKARVKSWYRFLLFQQEREKAGFSSIHQPSLHLVFTGNPGTGKTTLARLMAEIYFELGLLSRPDVIEADRSSLVGAFVGQTEEQVMNKVKEAEGGVLFIDEAYALKRQDASGSDYGQAAIDTLVAAMTSGEYARKFVVILAGYPEEMRHFLLANPGLRSRFPESNHYELPNYSDEELVAIGEKVADDNNYVLTAEAKRALLARLDRERVDATFGNARTVHNILLDAMFQKGSRFGAEAPLDEMAILTELDFVETESEEDRALSVDDLVGMDEAKRQLREIEALITVQKRRRELGLKTAPVELHATLVGNSGTGKTTFAHLYAQLLKKTGYLKRGHLKVVSRADLVSGYVGQTAQKTKAAIRDALGGVLLIDEAYSLSGGPNDYGKEAIDTLVDEMPKHGENLVVVLAGYDAPMRRLIESNPGLSSRIKRSIHFEDYSTNELVEIAIRYAEKFGYVMDEDVRSEIENRIRQMERPNARMALSLIDEAIARQSYRLVGQDVSESDFNQLLVVDISTKL
ncbi:AAA family ATPase [Exiguobacterium alkaliphilum]|uniref:AAA family ATPase n=1 Tax=Exiguobacterium alkaliphilum TaxID=1428684 RepID=A0ABT2KV72_9BACL|nr:AAA family ATPase [Exiguobacterium alkaliphilum]MCT4794285.1 AAA family ATPase [Exiguobacterium alkaliphilum]